MSSKPLWSNSSAEELVAGRTILKRLGEVLPHPCRPQPLGSYFMGGPPSSLGEVTRVDSPCGGMHVFVHTFKSVNQVSLVSG